MFYIIFYILYIIYILCIYKLCDGRSLRNFYNFSEYFIVNVSTVITYQKFSLRFNYIF